MAEEPRTTDPFVEMLRKERLERGISTTHLAGLLNIPSSTLSNYEIGKSGSAAPRVDLMRDWAYALDYELTLNKVEKPTRRRKSGGTDDLPADLLTVHLSRYQTALAMGILMSQVQTLRTDSPNMADDLQVIANILARSIH